VARRARTYSAVPLRGVTAAAGAPPDRSRWPASVPAMAQVLTDGLELGPATVLVGENGSGKSTLVEAVAMAYGLSPEGGSTNARHRTRASESAAWAELTLSRNAGGSRWGFFLRAETMHGFFSYLEANPGAGPEAVFHEMSHGESFLEVLRSRFRTPGLYVLDEPESALSFSGCLALIGVLNELLATGTAQVLMATHSPVLAALPGARILEAGPWGLRARAWEELELVAHHRAFLAAPGRYLRHLD
jgi:predicted ATPase